MKFYLINFKHFLLHFIIIWIDFSFDTKERLCANNTVSAYIFTGNLSKNANFVLFSEKKKNCDRRSRRTRRISALWSLVHFDKRSPFRISCHSKNPATMGVWVCRHWGLSIIKIKAWKKLLPIQTCKKAHFMEFSF